VREASAAPPDAAATWSPPGPIDVPLTLSLLQHGPGDPCQRHEANGTVWRTLRTPHGPATLRIRRAGSADAATARSSDAVSGIGEVEAQAWGPGAPDALADLPALLGAYDHPETFEPRHRILRDAHRRHAGLRIPRTGRVLESLIPAVLEQKVLGVDAAAAWRRLVTRYGELAPGPTPAGLRVAPSAQTWREIPNWEWHKAGVERRRAEVAGRCAREAGALERAAAENDPAAVYRRLLSIPGVGRWTAAQVGQRALGDADALPVGDYHLAAMTGWSLAGRTLAADEVEEFYEPWRPHRFRVVLLLKLTPGTLPPRRGPRLDRQQLHRL